MVIEVVTSAKRNLIEQHLHVRQRTDRHAALADFSFAQRVIRVIPHQRRQIEGRRKPRLSLRQQISKTLIGILSRAKARELPHGPQSPAVHGGMDSARIRRLAGETQIAFGIPVRQIRLGIKAANGMSGNSGEGFLPLRIFFERVL